MTTALEGGEGSASCPGRSIPPERLGTHCTGGWVGPRASLNRCGKSRLPPEFDPRTVQPVASRYTDYATRHTFWDVTPRDLAAGFSRFLGTSRLHFQGGCHKNTSHGSPNSTPSSICYLSPLRCTPLGTSPVS
jgi:hypothetical protein